MAGGWMGTILDVDLSSGRMERRDTIPYARDYLGGRGLAARIAWEEIPPDAGAYDAENRIIVATGPLTGTLAPTSGRTVMTAVSPRTYPHPWYTHSTLGGWFGAELKYAGFDALVIHGASDRPIYLEITDGDARLVEADDLWGRDARETQLQLRERLGDGAQVLAIGPAGENGVRLATVQHAEENAAGSSGFGAVWGSKNLKAIAVRGTGAVPVARPGALLKEVLEAGTFHLAPSPAALREEGEGGAAGLRPICSQACTFDCRVVTHYGRGPDGRRMPGFCIGGLYLSGGWRLGDYEEAGVHLPPGTPFDREQEHLFHDDCNRLGLDLCFRLVVQNWLIRCQQLGLEEIRGYSIAPEDGEWFRRFTREMAHREGLGTLFADGLRWAMDKLADELPRELIALGRELTFDFGFIAHREGRFRDREPLPFWVISAMMHASESRDPTIGTHQSVLIQADFLCDDREVARRQFRKVSREVWGYEEALEPTFDNKAPVALWSQNQHMLIDSLPLCDFAFPQLIRPMESRQEWREAEDVVGDLDLDRRLLAAVTGVEKTREELERMAERAFTLERLMLARAGRGRRMEEGLAPHFALPCRSDGTWIDAAGFSRLLDEYYAARGWDPAYGWPTPQKLRALGLEEPIPELEENKRRFPEAALPDSG